MTSTTVQDEVFKQDRRGRVRVPRERREALLEEFARSGLSAASFARMAGIKYPTFANWRQQQRRKAPGTVRQAVPERLVGGGTVRLLEAVVEDHTTSAGGGRAGLVIELPGGSRLTVDSPALLAMAAELVSLIAQRSRQGC